MTFRNIFFTCAATSVISLSLSAATVTYNFSENGTGNLGLTSLFASSPSGAPSLTASGFSSNNHTAQLYGKNVMGTDEIGVGLNLGEIDPDHEIQGTGFVQIDISQLLTGYSNLTFQMNSTTNGETWVVYNTNTAGSIALADTIKVGSDETSHSFTASKTYLDFAVQPNNTFSEEDFSNPNVLLKQITGTARVPEPGTMSLLGAGFGLIGLGTIRRGRQVRKSRTA